MSRRRSIFEPIPTTWNADNLQQSVNNDEGRVWRRIRRTHREGVRLLEGANAQIPHTFHAGPAAWNAMSDPNGLYQSMLKDALSMRLIRDFGMHNDYDRRVFFEHTGRLSFVIYRARVWFQRRFEKAYQILRLLFPREIVAMIMTRHRDSLPRVAPLLHRYKQRRLTNLG